MFLTHPLKVFHSSFHEVSNLKIPVIENNYESFVNISIDNQQTDMTLEYY